ncbi:MAG: DUF4388 domain-containing protein [Deltaproteobacteria bacterium]|nr:DUF4388 domain-containing protein [Deltaproteobacteria bacterium]
MQGKLSEIGFSEMLSLATAGKKTGGLMLCSRDETVEVFFSDGQIVHATCPIGEGEKAIYYPVTWEDGVFKLQADWTAPATTIHRSSEQILDTVRAVRRDWESVLEVIPTRNCIFQLYEPAEAIASSITITRAALRVLCKVDGRRSVQEIAEAIGTAYAQTARTLSDLSKAGLVVLVAPGEESARATSEEKIVSPALMAALVGHLTEFIGPIAPIMIRDQIRALNEFQDRFPKGKLEDLIVLVGREIADAKLRNEFQVAVSKARIQLSLQENSVSDKPWP